MSKMKIRERKLIVILLTLLAASTLLVYLWLTRVQQQEFLRFKRHYHNILKNSINTHSAEFYIRQHGSYWIMYNYIVASHSYLGNESVTLALHGEYNDLRALRGLVRRWRGPISFTLFTNGIDFERAKDIILYLTRCDVYGEDIRNFVTFNFLIHEDHFPTIIPRSEGAFFERQASCMKNPFEQTNNQSYREKYNIRYPINMARNIARYTASTYYVLAIDMDYLTTLNFPQTFLKIISQLTVPNPLKTVFALPVVTAPYGCALPESKKELNNYNLFQYMPSLEERIPDIQLWFNYKESENVFDVRQHVGVWQPWYVSVNEYEPLADERYLEDSYVHRRLKIDLLEMLNYDFVILNNAFLVHYMSPNITLDRDLMALNKKGNHNKKQLQYYQKLLILKNFLLNFL